MKFRYRILVFIAAMWLLNSVGVKLLPRGANGQPMGIDLYQPIFIVLSLVIAFKFHKLIGAKKNLKRNQPSDQEEDYDDDPVKPYLQSSTRPASANSGYISQNTKLQSTAPVANADYTKMREQEILNLKKAYDFTTVEGINSIPVPCREVNGNSPTGRVEYYLRSQCAAAYEQSGDEELAIAALKKAQELMFVSDMIWKRYDFLRLPKYLYEIGRWDEADKELAKIDAFFKKQKSECPSYILDKFKSAKICETDLMEAHSCSPYCSECAKYINRVYSISGRDKRFPKVPRELTNDPAGHYLSCLSWFPYVENVYDPPFDCKNIVSYSNRPFRDERTPEEIARYNSWKCASSKNMSDQELIEQELLERAKSFYQDNQTFMWIQENLPGICPKSLSGFRRMRTQNTKNYQKIVEEAEKLGKEI